MNLFIPSVPYERRRRCSEKLMEGGIQDHFEGTQTLRSAEGVLYVIITIHSV